MRGLVTPLFSPVPNRPQRNTLNETVLVIVVLCGNIMTTINPMLKNKIKESCLARLNDLQDCGRKPNEKSNQRHEKGGEEQGRGDCELFLKGKHEGKRNNLKDESSLVLQ